MPGVPVTKPTQHPPALLQNERGAIMIMGVFMAMIMVGFIYYVAGVGDTILLREQMQDASDAGAWAAAVMQARGMNVIVLLNMIMAAITAVLVALNILIVLLKAAIAIGEVMALIPTPVTAAIGVAVVEIATPTKEIVEGVRDVVKEFAEEVLPILTKAGRVLAKVTPWVAEVKAVSVATNQYGHVAIVGVYWGKTLMSSSLPVEDDECSVIQDRAGEYVRDLALKPFGTGDLNKIIDKILGFLEDAAAYTEGTICDGASQQFGADPTGQMAQIIGENCLDDENASIQTVGSCTSYGVGLCNGSNSSSDHPTYFSPQQYEVYHEQCGPMATADCATISNCHQMYTEATQPQEQEDPNAGSIADGADIAPQRVRTDAYLGDAWFQARYVLLGRDGALDAAKSRVELGNWGRPVEDDAALDTAMMLSRVSFTQAEFYYHDAGAHALRDDWMWHMRWKARLRRFSFGDTGLLNTACESAPDAPVGVCQAISGAADLLNNIVVH